MKPVHRRKEGKEMNFKPYANAGIPGETFRWAEPECRTPKM